MEPKFGQGFGMVIGVSVVVAAGAVVYFVSVGYSEYQQNLSVEDQTEQNIGVPVSALELPPPNNLTSSQDLQEELTVTPNLTITTTPSPTSSISPTGSITPLSTSTNDINFPTNTPSSTPILSPTSTPTPSQTPRVDTPTPSPTQPTSTPTPIPPTSTNTRVPTIDPKLCKVEPEETSHPHYCTPTPGS